MTEAESVRVRYARRAEEPDLALPVFREERERALRRWIGGCGLNPRDARAFEIGCGSGGNLAALIRLGFTPANLTGVELIEERVAEARRQLPSDVQVIGGDALEVQLAPVSFDVVMLFTVFTSLLDEEYRRRLAAHAWSLVKAGGGVLWYDFCFDNPRNPDVRGIPVRDVRALFPEGAMQARRITLAPPLARAAVRVHRSLYHVLNVVPLLRTHILCWIRKEVN
jgi:SAM-dependent methyltransferase